MDKDTLALMNKIEMWHRKHEILEKQPAPDIATLQAENTTLKAEICANARQALVDKYEVLGANRRAGLMDIVNGNYDNANEINAARAYAAKVLK
jgi:hypothetical protein